MRPEALQPMQPVSGRELAAWGSKLIRRLWERIQWGKDSTDTYKQHINALWYVSITIQYTTPKNKTLITFFPSISPDREIFLRVATPMVQKKTALLQWCHSITTNEVTINYHHELGNHNNVSSLYNINQLPPLYLYLLMLMRLWRQALYCKSGTQ